MKASDFKFRSQYKQAVAKQVKKYRKKGATYKEIANLLNDYNYETFTGYGRWHPQTIHRLCK